MCYKMNKQNIRIATVLQNEQTEYKNSYSYYHVFLCNNIYNFKIGFNGNTITKHGCFGIIDIWSIQSTLYSTSTYLSFF